VQQIKQALNKKGYDSGKVNAQWDQNAQKALRNFQQAQGMEPTGMIDIGVVKALGVDLSAKPQRGQQQAQGKGAPLHVGPSDIRSIKQALSQGGYDVGAINAKWDQNTQKALQQYQQAQGMASTGNLTISTLSQLGVAQDLQQVLGAQPSAQQQQQQQQDQQRQVEQPQEQQKQQAEEQQPGVPQRAQPEGRAAEPEEPQQPQQQPQQQPPQQQQQQQELQEERRELQEERQELQQQEAAGEIRQMDKEQLVGKDLYDVENERIGEVKDVVEGEGGEVEAVLLDVGGFLGIGGKQVAVPAYELQAEGDRIVTQNLTSDEVEKLPEFQKAEGE
jgi:sporulation protein YlmC with PRC-barrel domain